MAGPRIFISYSRDDIVDAQQLYDHLTNLRETYGATVFFDQDGIQASDDWQRKLHDALDNCDIFVLLLSRSFVASPVCRDLEARRALERRRETPDRVKVLPVLLSDCDYEGLRPDEHAEGVSLDQVQAAGPYQGGRLMPMSKVPDRDAAWSEIVKQIKRNIYVDNSTAALAPRPSGKGDQPSGPKDPDWLLVAARCDRTDLVTAVTELARGRGGLVVVHGPFVQAPNPSLGERLKGDLAEDGLPSEVIHLLNRAEPRNLQQFKEAVHRNANPPDGDKKDAPGLDIDAKLGQLLNGFARQTSVLVVAHYVELDRLNRKQIQTELKLAWSAQEALARWASQRQTAPSAEGAPPPTAPSGRALQVIVLLVLRDYGKARQAGLWTRVRGWMQDDSALARVDSAFRAAFPDADEGAAQRCIELTDLPSNELGKWRDMHAPSFGARRHEISAGVDEIIQSGSRSLRALQLLFEETPAPQNTNP